MNTYNTPQEFLEDVQAFLKYFPVIKTVKDENFTRLTNEQISKIEIFKNKTKEEILSSNYLVDRLVEQISKVLEPSQLTEVQNKIAFGKAYNTQFNALCIKSYDDKYAILLYEGLFTLIHKRSKLLIATENPNCVISCNRGDVKNINADDYRKYANELIENYKQLHSPVGAMIKLDDEHDILSSVNISLQELFVLCHELGHFFNRDLENNNNFSHLSKSEWQIFDDNKNHEIEYKADLTGFTLFEKAVMNGYNGLPRKYLLAPLAQLFDLLTLISDDKKEAESHPHPIKRITNIILHHFDESTAINYLKTYDQESGYSANDFFQSTT